MDIGQPFVIKQCNKTMGGVDRNHQNVDGYSIVIRSNKCSWPICAFIAWIFAFRKPSQRPEAHVGSSEQDPRSRHLPHDWKSVPRPWYHPRLLSPGRLTGFATSQDMVLEQIHPDRLDHLNRPWPTQLKCACRSTKTKHKYCKCNVGIPSWQMLHQVPHRVNYYVDQTFWISSKPLASEACSLAIILIERSGRWWAHDKCTLLLL